MASCPSASDNSALVSSECFRICHPEPANGRRLLTLAAREADIVGLSGITFLGGGAVSPDLSGWRVSGVDERVNLVREVAGAERYARLELNALVQRVVVT